MRFDIIIGAALIAVAILAAALILRPGRYQFMRDRGASVILDTQTGTTKLQVP